MRNLSLFLFILVCPLHVFPGTRYVWQSSPTNGPGTSWETAFHDIQSAIDAAGSNDTVLVESGVYSNGSRVTPDGILLNRIVAENPVMIRSFNGPETTIIKGEGPLGNSAVRCAYISSGVTLTGFTLSNGFTRTTAGDYFLDRSGGGVYSAGGIVSNCVVVDCSVYCYGGGIYGGTTTFCTVQGCLSSEGYGGGIYGGTVSRSTILECYAKYGGGGVASAALTLCTVASNQAHYAGGGMHGGAATNCMVNDNSTTNSGGGVFAASINRTTVTGNRALEGYGGGIYSGLVYNCTISSNRAYYGGGGTYGGVVSNSAICSNTVTYSGGGCATGTVVNCVIFANTASQYGGGAVSSFMTNCTVAGNSAGSGGGGTYLADAKNSIIYYNTAPDFPNCQAGNYSYCCTTPNPGGTGNITGVPGFVDHMADDYHLGSTSVLINAGNNTFAPAGLDRDGNARIRGAVVDIGAYESPYVLINASAMTNTSISPSGRVAAVEFSDQTFVVSAAPGYYVSNVVVDGVSVGGVTFYQFHYLVTGHTISAQSALLPEGPTNVINASAGFGGTIVPSGAVFVPSGSNQVFTIRANPVFANISNVKTNGYSMGPTNSVIFVNVITNHTIDAFFFTYSDTNGYSIGKFGPGSSSNIVLSWMALDGWLYTLQRTPQLIPAAWSNVPPYIEMLCSGESYLTNSMGTNDSMFYRFIARPLE